MKFQVIYFVVLYDSLQFTVQIEVALPTQPTSDFVLQASHFFSRKLKEACEPYQRTVTPRSNTSFTCPCLFCSRVPALSSYIYIHVQSQLSSIRHTITNYTLLMEHQIWQKGIISALGTQQIVELGAQHCHYLKICGIWNVSSRGSMAARLANIAICSQDLCFS